MTKKIFGFDIDKRWNYENGFYLTSHTDRLSKMLAHYELYKSIINLPGCVVECGVYKGASFIRFATFRDILESSFSRKIVGFDAFGEFPKQDEKDDAKFIQEFEGEGGFGISVNELKDIFTYKSFDNYELIRGDIVETIPEYILEHPELKIALLHIDVDVYRPSVVILNSLFEKVVRGGLIILDDYGLVAGETQAVDEFVDGKDMQIEKLPISHTASYIKKK